MKNLQALEAEKQRLVTELDKISFVGDRGQRIPKMPEYGEEIGENASEVEEYSNRMTLVKELDQALQNLEEKMNELKK